MDPESTAPARKFKFAPKKPTRKPVKSEEPKTEAKEDPEAAKTRDLLRRVNEAAGRGRGKIDKKSAPAQVAFGHGAASKYMRSYGTPKRAASILSDGSNGSGQRVEKEYKEPWDYYGYYPVTLPLRRPYSGDPEHLDEEEFGEASVDMAYDEDNLNSAVELGLMDENEDARMFFLQLPAHLPWTKRSATADHSETVGSLKPSKPEKGCRLEELPNSKPSKPEKGCRLEELPPGFMGKLLVYKSGVVKLKLGDTLYDVSPGSDCTFANDVVAINTEGKQCCSVGELNKRVVVTPDVDSLLTSMANLE